MFKKISKVIINVLFHGSLLAILLILATTTVQKAKGEQPNIFGYTIYVVLTDSMTGELEVGDAILSKKNAEYEVGSVVTYIATSGLLKGQPITHKVVKVYKQNGIDMLQTQGVKAGAPLDTPIRRDQILGVMQKKLGVSSSLINFFKKPIVSFSIIVIPISIIAGIEIYSLKNKRAEEEENNE